MRPIGADTLLHYLERDLPASVPITSDLSPFRVATSLLTSNLTKKLVNVEKPPEAASKIALDKFLHSNIRCACWELLPTSWLDDYIVGGVQKTLDDFFHPNGLPLANLSNISEGFSVGNGMNIGARDQSFLSKVWFSKLSSTSRFLYQLYCMGISSDPKWSRAEKRRMNDYGLSIVPGSKWTPVPKTVEAARGVATEPTVNMLFQRGLGKLIEDRLKSFFNIELDKQPELNQQLAQLGSISGEFSTIDLSDASDSISTRLSSLVIPSDFLAWINRTRSPKITLPGGQDVELAILSTMGNGLTFPLQTALFAAIVVTCLRLSDKVMYNVYDSVRDRTYPGNFGVFGDDIIIPKRCNEIVLRALRLFGFVPNVEKSFSAGYFRESCGGDYYRGVNVRSVYIKRLVTPQDVYSSINRLLVFCARHDVYLEHTLDFLLKQVRFVPVPFIEGDTAGVKVSSLHAPHFYDIKTRSALYRSYQAEVRDVDLTRSRKAEKILGYRLDSNPDGALVSFVGGFLRDGRLGLPTRGPTRFKVRWSIVPNWDYIPSAVLNIEQAKRWKALSDAAALLSGSYLT